MPDYGGHPAGIPQRCGRRGLAQGWRGTGPDRAKAAPQWELAAKAPVDRWTVAVGKRLPFDELELRIQVLALYYQMDGRVERLFDAIWTPITPPQGAFFGSDSLSVQFG